MEEWIGRRNGILNAGIHALAASRTMNMRGVAAQDDGAGNDVGCQPVMNMET